MVVLTRLKRTGPAFARQLKSLTLDSGSTMHQTAEWLRLGYEVPWIGEVAVAFADGGPVGWAAGFADDFGPPGTRDVHVFVAPPWRRKGVGRRLVRFLGREGVLVGYHSGGPEKAFWEALGVRTSFFPNDGWLIWAHPNGFPGPGELPGLR